MNELFCKEFLDYFPTYTELKDLRLTFITNCIFNNFITHTSIMLNIVTIYAIHKTSAMAKTLKTLLLSLAFSDLAVGLFSQPLYTFFLSLWGLPGTRDLIGSVVAAFGFIVPFVVYTRIYFTVRRHKKQIHSMQVQEVAHSDEIKNFIVLIKSTVSLFYVYLLLLICYLPFFICSAVIRILGSNNSSRKAELGAGAREAFKDTFYFVLV